MIGMFAIASAVIVTHAGKVKHKVSARKVVIASLLIAAGVAIISFTDAANLMLNVTDTLLHKRATVESRFDLWGGAMRAFSDSPIVGIGYQGVDGLYGYLHGSG
ncbi:MAG: O-antigen ligase family protein, partial [Collinsella aerofaciens]